MSIITRRIIPATAVAGVMALMTTGCLAGEGGGAEAATDGGEWSSSTLSVDWATYNPLSLIIKEQGLIEATLGDDVDVEWLQSAGSNKANELLRSGSVDVGSTAGSAALFARTAHRSR